MVFQGFSRFQFVFYGFMSVFIVFQGSRLVFHGSIGPGQFSMFLGGVFMAPGGFLRF